MTPNLIDLIAAFLFALLDEDDREVFEHFLCTVQEEWEKLKEEMVRTLGGLQRQFALE